MPGYFNEPHHVDQGRRDPVEVAQRLSRYHTDAEQLGKIAAAAEVKKLVLTHMIPPKDGEKMCELAAKNFKGQIIVGSDLLHTAPLR